MTNAPFILSKARDGYRLGHDQFYDHMLYDGLEDAYEGKLMGAYAELCAETHGFTRDEQDAFAAESVGRAQRAVSKGYFRDEIVPVKVAGLRARRWYVMMKPPDAVISPKSPSSSRLSKKMAA